MNNFIVNIYHAGYGGFGLLIYLYIKVIYEITTKFILKRKIDFTNYVLGFLYTIIFSYLISFLGKAGSIFVIFLIFIYSLKLIKEKRFLFEISDIGFALLVGLILGTFFHSANSNLSSGIIPGDVYSYASWFSSLLEYPNQFKELIINEFKFGNFFEIAGNGILIIGSSLFRLIDINPINFISITLPVTGLILLKKSSTEFSDLENHKGYVYIFNQSSILNYLIILALLPYPYFLVESPSTFIGLALLLNSAAIISQHKISGIKDIVSHIFYLYAFYCSKLAVCPSIFIKNLIQNKRNLYLSIIPIFLVSIILLYTHNDFITIILSPNFSTSNILKVVLIITYLFFLGFNYIDLLTVISSSAIFIFSYAIFGSIISGCALMLYKLKYKNVENPKKSYTYKYLLIFLAMLCVFLSYPSMKTFIMNLIILFGAISYLSFNEKFLLKNYFLSFNKNFPLFKINYFLVIFTSILVLTSIFSKPYDCKKFICSAKTFDSYDYMAYKKIRELTRNNSLIFIDNPDGLNLSSLSRRQFFLSGWENTKLRNNENKISELISINKKILNLDDKSCKLARDFSKNDLYIMRERKHFRNKIVNSNHKKIYSNNKYEIFKSC